MGVTSYTPLPRQSAGRFCGGGLYSSFRSINWGYVFQPFMIQDGFETGSVRGTYR